MADTTTRLMTLTERIALQGVLRELPREHSCPLCGRTSVRTWLHLVNDWACEACSNVAGIYIGPDKAR